MASFDITSLFTNIPLDATVNISLNESFDKKQCVSYLDQASFEKLLQLAMKELVFIFDKTIYKQFDNAAMSSPLAPTGSNDFSYMLSCRLLLR